MKKDILTFKACGQTEGLRLDKYLVSLLADFSRSSIQKIIKEGRIKVNNQKVESVSYKLKPDDDIEVNIESLDTDKVPLSSVNVPIIYQDKDIIVINKPIGLIVHPAGPNKDSVIGSLLNKGIELSQHSQYRPGVVHRLDKETSGLMVLTKTETAHLNLYNQFKERRVVKEYIALVKGILTAKESKIEVPLKREKYKPKMKVSFLDAKKALTYYKVLEERKGYSLVRVYLKTGRMHQIRVHFSYLGHPLVGDKKYNKEPEKRNRLYLHSAKLGFYHPVSDKYTEFRSPAPFSLDDLC